MPTPLPPKMQLSHMPTSGEMPANGFRLSCEQSTEPQAMAVVAAANVAPGRSAEPQLLAFQVAQRLIDRQGGCDGGFRLVGAVFAGITIERPPRSAAGMENDPLVQDFAFLAGNFLGVYLVGLRRQAGVRLQRVPTNGPHRGRRPACVIITPKITQA